ncbi:MULTISPECIES: FtsX-like permease family protein [Nocardiaceae]|uniref:FtsX-like permease family protein n=1 Tax=Rhodococcoides yunnanense TaxID=278209 RepID=A0ABU4BEK8_9NOCA|nr:MULTISPECIES: FtsX-like permease family protein [Rhodococcus]MDI9896268.1 hypothetical protein [Rhodococcus sp. IEGM 1381]MDV6262620.1 FtsX-like permease family protein [Rhodococcus yunnanensis]
MLTYTIRTVWTRRRSYAPTAVVLFSGLVLVLAFVSLLASSGSASNPDDEQFLLLFPVILGSWILAISLFAISSTVSVATLARAEEFDTLRRLGATEPQLRLLVALETAVLGIVVAVPAVAVGIGLGSVIFHRLRTIGIVDSATGYAPGILAAALAATAIVVLGGVAAQFGSRSENSHRGDVKRRRVIAALVTVLGIASSTAAFAVEPTGAGATATAGPGTVFVSIGLALLAREILGGFCRVAAFLFQKLGVSGYLAAINAVSAQGARPTTMFFTLLVGVCVGTLTMQNIENASAGAGPEGQLMASINYSVVGLVASFMAIALINNLIASISRRRSEFGTMVRIGATARQTVRMLTLESVLAVVAAGTTGTIGAVLAVAPYAYVKGGSPTDALSVPVVVLVLAAGTLLTIAATAAAGRRTVAAAV